MPDAAPISIRGITKRYGNLCAVRDLDLEVAEGEILGFLGLNGAGKSTTSRIPAMLSCSETIAGPLSCKPGRTSDMLMAAGTWAGLHALAPENVETPSATLIASLAIGAASRRRSSAGALGGLPAFAAFLLDYVGRLWKPAEAVAWLSPFRYYSRSIW